MKRTTAYFFICTLMCFAVMTWAQTKDKATDKKAVKPIPTYPVFMGKSDISGASITLPESVFDSLLKQGLTARDSSGNPLKFHGFIFSYGERNLYEDSIGNLMVITDLLTEYCSGNTLSPNILANQIFDRTKRGDTAYIDDVKLTDANGNSKLGRSMRIVLTK